MKNVARVYYIERPADSCPSKPLRRNDRSQSTAAVRKVTRVGRFSDRGLIREASMTALPERLLSKDLCATMAIPC
jgi:hypothetical protein